MAKSPHVIGIIATIGLAFLAAVPQPAHAGDDTELAKQLWAQGRLLSEESSGTSAKMQDAIDREDMSAVCTYARESQRNSQAQFDLVLRMSNLDLDPRNTVLVEEQLTTTRAALESITELISQPECNAPVDSVDDNSNEAEMDVLDIHVATARDMDTDGSASFADERWSVACSYLTAAQSSYANNSSFALELSERFAAEENPQPQLVALSAELAGLEKAVTPKRDIACKNEARGF